MAFARVHLTLASLAAGFVLAHAAAVANGKAAYVKNGCWQCHGFEGQGSTATSGGIVIADTHMPLEAFSAYVRDPRSAMPPYHAEILPDSDLADIYAYLGSLPKPAPAKDIPLLNNLSAR